MDDRLEATQADRDAAADLEMLVRGGRLASEMREGLFDAGHSVQAMIRQRLAGVKEGLEMAWRDGFNCARNCVSEDEAFCLTEDVEGDAWLDSATARAIPVKADDRERA